MTTEDGGWRLLGVLDSPSFNITGSQPFGSVEHGIYGEVGFSIDLDTWHDEEDTSFDLMIEYGDEDTYREVVTRFTKNGSSFFSAPTGVSTGKHGIFGTESTNGVYGTFCASVDKCLEYGHDYFNFSTTGDLPKFSSVTCGYYGTQDGIYAYWKDCPKGDNVQKMTYWIRY